MPTFYIGPKLKKKFILVPDLSFMFPLPSGQYPPGHHSLTLDSSFGSPSSYNRMVSGFPFSVSHLSASPLSHLDARFSIRVSLFESCHYVWWRIKLGVLLRFYDLCVIIVLINVVGLVFLSFYCSFHPISPFIVPEIIELPRYVISLNSKLGQFFPFIYSWAYSENSKFHARWPFFVVGDYRIFFF